jgi:hypothetical protein
VDHNLRRVVHGARRASPTYCRVVTENSAEDVRLRAHLADLNDDDLFELFADQTASVSRFAALVKTALTEGYVGDGIIPLKAQASSVRQLGVIAEEFVDRVIEKELP